MDHWTLDIGHWTLDTGHWLLIIDHLKRWREGIEARGRRTEEGRETRDERRM